MPYLILVQQGIKFHMVVVLLKKKEQREHFVGFMVIAMKEIHLPYLMVAKVLNLPIFQNVNTKQVATR